MSIGLVGRKCGMTRVFTEEGDSIPVTVLEVLPNRITQIKTVESDGYDAIQVTVGSRRQSLLNKPSIGQFQKAGVTAGEGFWEFRVSQDDLQEHLSASQAAANESKDGAAEDGESGEGAAEAQADTALGAELTVSIFSDGQVIDVTGISKGKGFAGVIKRHNFSMQDATHGNSLSHRAHGSIGQNQTPGRVFKGKKMAGHMGSRRTTIQNLQIVSVDKDRNLILVKGSIPGAKTGKVFIKPAVKATNQKAEGGK